MEYTNRNSQKLPILGEIILKLAPAVSRKFVWITCGEDRKKIKEN
jgi:hypothetical protein